jgi:DNA (cytosine-5)-methyltransferase 1
MKTHVDLFSGIGGFALAVRWAGVQTIAFAEIDDYASKVLAKNFPGVMNYGDIRNIPDGLSAWLVTGGFPCQPFSVAGKRGGAGDDRWLWPAMAEVIERVRPAWVLAENVPGIVKMELDTVLSDLERIQYTAWPVIVPACAVDAQHRRERVWIVAHADSTGITSSRKNNRMGWQRKSITKNVADVDSGRFQHGNAPYANGAGLAQREGVTGDDGQEQPAIVGACRWQPEPGMGRVANGIPRRVDRLRGLGNAIVPQVAYQLIRMMIETEAQRGQSN